MSTYFATFDDIDRARNMINELVSSGVRPDDLSAVTRLSFAGTGDRVEMVEEGTVGDASFFVGRDDDPTQDPIPAQEPLFGDVTPAREFAGTMGISTGETGRNVESVDQSDDSQSAAEDLTEPDDYISQGEHELDDLALAVRTGFPTTVPVLDSVREGEGGRIDQLVEGIEALALPGGGTIIGGGALATAAFDLNSNPENFRAYLKDEGVSEDAIESFTSGLDNGHVLVAVNVAPGSVAEPVVEAIATRWGAIEGGLYDAPRFGNDSGYVA